MSLTATYAVHRETRASIVAALRLGLDSLRADVLRRSSGWATGYFCLAGESSHQKGTWGAWCIQAGSMDFLSDGRIEAPFVQRRASHRQVKGADDTAKYKKFAIASPTFWVARPPAPSAASTSPRSTEGAASTRKSNIWRPLGRAKGRPEGATYAKFVGGSTPGIKSLSHAEHAREAANVDRRFHVECLHCGAVHSLLWGGKDTVHGLKRNRGQPATLNHICSVRYGCRTLALLPFSFLVAYARCRS